MWAVRCEMLLFIATVLFAVQLSHGWTPHDASDDVPREVRVSEYNNTLYVGTESGPGCGEECGTYDCPCTDGLRTVVSAAPNSTLIYLREGTYSGKENREINFMGKSIALMAWENEKVLFECEYDIADSSPLFQFVSGEGHSSAVQGIEIARCDSRVIIECRDSAPLLSGIHFHNNSVSGRGWTAEDDDGDHYTWLVQISGDSEPTVISRCWFDANGAVESGVQVIRGSAVITECLFTDNGATFGMISVGRAGDVLFEHSRMYGNRGKGLEGPFSFEVAGLSIANAPRSREETMLVRKKIGNKIDAAWNGGMQGVGTSAVSASQDDNDDEEQARALFNELSANPHSILGDEGEQMELSNAVDAVVMARLDAEDEDDLDRIADVVIRNVTFNAQPQRRMSTTGRAIWAQGIPASVLLENCTVVGHRRKGLRAFTSTTSQRSSSGSGAALYFWSRTKPANVVVRNCTFEDNRSRTLGGSLYSFYWNTTVEHCTFSNDHVLVHGGSIYLHVQRDEVSFNRIYNSTFTNCTSVLLGGGAVFAYTPATVKECHFSGCRARDVLGFNFVAQQLLRRRYGSALALFNPGASNAFGISRNTSGSVGKALHKEQRDVRPIVKWIIRHLLDDTIKGRAFHVSGCSFTENLSGTAGALALPRQSSGDVGNCTFDSNVSRGRDGGGAVYIGDDASPAISNCTFRNNSAWNGSGGAVYADRTSAASITDCRFHKNFAKVSGGAVTVARFRDDNNGGSIIDDLFGLRDDDGWDDEDDQDQRPRLPVSIQGTIFESNAAEVMGGGLSAGGDIHLNVEGCVFVNNTAIGKGGGLSLTLERHANVEVTSTQFFENRVTSFLGVGGGVKLSFDGFSMFNKCVFGFNYAALDGGGISASDGARPEFFDCTIYENVAERNGGGISMEGQVRGRMERVNLVGNRAGQYGGGAYMELTDMEIHGGIFLYNVAEANGGGAYLGRDSTPIFNKTLITYCEAGDGGGVEVSSTSLPRFHECTMSFNRADNKGGALNMYHNAAPIMLGGSMAFNYASTGGGIAVQGRASPSIHGVSLLNNTAYSQGGAAWAGDHGMLNITRCDVRWNVAGAGNGGGLYILDFARLFAGFTHFSENYAQSGGAMYIKSRNEGGLNVSSCSFHANVAELEGGAISMANNAVVHVHKCNMTQNVVRTGEGGAVYARSTTRPHILYCIIDGNRARTVGGGLSIGDLANVSITETLITNNRANVDGGGLHVSDSAVVGVERSNFTRNTALANGGGVFMQCTRTSLIDCIIVNNTASVSGGGIALESCISARSLRKLSSILVWNNTATSGGGIAFLRGRHIDLNPGSLALFPQFPPSLPWADDLRPSNERVLRDAAPDWNATSISKISIVGNRAGSVGGGIYVEVVNDVPELDHSLIMNNTAYFGGAVFVEADLLLDKCTIAGNHAHYGGSFVAMPSSNQQPTSFQTFCKSCEVHSSNWAGYESENHYATREIVAKFSKKGCPIETYLGVPFQMSLQLEDSFGSLITGALLRDFNVTASVSLTKEASVNCTWWSEDGEPGPPPPPTSFVPDTGSVVFDGIMVSRESEEVCDTVFNCTEQHHAFTIHDVTCNVPLKGCAEGFRVNDDDADYRTCVEVESSTDVMDKMKLVLVALVAVLSALVLILGTAFLLVHVRKYLREKRFASREIPDFNTAGSFTLSELLNDKNITVIPWERLEIQKRLGVGASGSVSLASMQRSPSAPVEEVAVKELHGIFDPTEELVQEFVHEVSIAAALHHPNVVQFIGVARKGELELALITEVMERGSLAELLNKKKHNLPWKLRLKLARDAAKGMAYLHKCNLIHRDLKPGNLLVNKKWVCKVSDFGISRGNPKQEQTMTAVGTPAYMAPEVLSNSRYSEKADVYSFGIMLHELYAGVIPYSYAPYNRMSKMELCKEVVEHGLRPSCEGIPERLGQLIADCWDADPTLRPSFPEIVLRLRRLENMKLPFATYAPEEDRQSMMQAMHNSHGDTLRDAFVVVVGESDPREAFGEESDEEPNVFEHFEEEGRDAAVQERSRVPSSYGDVVMMEDLVRSTRDDAE